MDPRFLRNRTAVDHRHVSENMPIRILERDAHVADGSGCLQVIIMGIDLQNAVGEMHQFGRVDHVLAGCSGDIHFIVVDPLAVHPECKGAEPACLGKILCDPGAMRAQRFRQVLDQRGKESLSRFGGSPLENRLQRFVGFKILERLGAIEQWGGHGRKV